MVEGPDVACYIVHSSVDKILMDQFMFVWFWPIHKTWWRHKMETFSALLAICKGNPSGTGGFPSQKPVMRSFHIFFALRLNKELSK